MGPGVTLVESFMEICSVKREELGQGLRPQRDIGIGPKTPKSLTALAGAVPSADEGRQCQAYSAARPLFSD